ncbi:hypothetical protein Bpfe_023431, partial [Biomphalaria pfeifferi]
LQLVIYLYVIEVLSLRHSERDATNNTSGAYDLWSFITAKCQRHCFHMLFCSHLKNFLKQLPTIKSIIDVLTLCEWRHLFNA